LHTEQLGFLAVSKGLTNQIAIQTDATTAIGEPEQAHKAHNMAASNNRDHTYDNSVVACSHHLHIDRMQVFAHIPFVVNHAFNVTPRARGGNKTLTAKFLQEKVQLKLMLFHLQRLFTLHWYR